MRSKAVSKKKPGSKSAASSRSRSALGTELRVGIKQLDHAGGLPLPSYQSRGAAGLDLIAAVPAKKPVMLPPGERKLLPTGLVMEIPEGFEAQVRPRSGLALKHGITVLNTPGTIDADYRGEIGVILYNAGSEPFRVARGDRIAQLVIAPVTQAVLVAVDTVTQTARGAGGFGSTGASAETPKSSATTKKPKRSAKNGAPGMDSAKSAASAKKPKANAKFGKTPAKPAEASRKTN